MQAPRPSQTYVPTALVLATVMLLPVAALVVVPDVGGQAPANADRALTVVAVIDGGFNPCHYDFLGSQHPWNRDADTTNDIDLTQDPSTYIDGHPGAFAIDLPLPTSEGDDVTNCNRDGAGAAEVLGLAPITGGEGDPEAPASPSSVRTGAGAGAGAGPGLAATPTLGWFPGTKVIAAASFSGFFFGSNSDHGQRSAASAVGNYHGSCPECLVVLIDGSTPAALAWAASQPWIDIITNSYGHSIVGGPVRDNIYFGSPVEATRDASNEGQTIVFSAGNGLANAFVVPRETYWSSEKGPDWMVTVGAVSPSTKATYSGAGKPVDISSIGTSYPSTGGTTANGTGTHSGTSNAAPVTAGYFGKVLQQARELLGDTAEGYAGGVVASGTPVACGSARPACPLGDGVLTKAELQELVFHNVLPSTAGVALATTWPSTEYAYYYQGHGFLRGKVDGMAAYNAEWQQMADVAKGDAVPLPRPTGETTWMTIDSKCRQRLWGAWDHGYYDGTEPTLDPQVDPVATAFDAWCDGVPPDLLLTVHQSLEML